MDAWARAGVYALVGATASALQFGSFDCSELPLVSFLAGFGAVLGACLTVEWAYRVSRVTARAGVRLARAAGVGLLGIAGVAALCWVTIATHLCG